MGGPDRRPPVVAPMHWTALEWEYFTKMNTCAAVVNSSMLRRYPCLAERCNFIAMSGYCHDMLSVVVVVVCDASVLWQDDWSVDDAVFTFCLPSLMTTFERGPIDLGAETITARSSYASAVLWIVIMCMSVCAFVCHMRPLWRNDENLPPIICYRMKGDHSSFFC